MISIRPVEVSRKPRHVGIIMDGNGRWALRRQRPRVVGHRVGATAVRKTAETAIRLGIEQLTLFAFSSENWKRPPEEVNYLMRLFLRFLQGERDRLIENGIRLRAIGRLSELPKSVQKALEEAIEASRDCDRLTLCLAVNYGSRCEIVDACRKLAALASAGELCPADIDEAAVEESLYQSDMPPLDLVIRTAGEMRLSNFLLWQAAYAEFWVTPVCWPDFREKHLIEAVNNYGRRERRFGGLPGR